MTDRDSAVFAGQPAWHGLGRVVEDAPTPAEALRLAKLDWSVLETAGVSGLVNFPGEAEPIRMVTDESKLLVRSDTREVLACVGSGYQPVQNADLADLAISLAGESAGAVRVESAASIYSGRRVWFLLRGEPFAINAGKDEIHRYLLLANGHDGSLALTVMPTSIRVVCRNTLAMAVGAAKRAGNLAWIKHIGNMEEKRTQAATAMRGFQQAGETFREKAEALSNKPMNRDDIQAFWTDAYSKLEEPIPTNPRTDAENKSREKAIDALALWARTFDRERTIAGTNAWNAVNAITHWYDHQRQTRAKDETVRRAKRIEKAIIGEHVATKLRAFDLALAI